MRQFCHICKKQVDLKADSVTGAMRCVFCDTVLFTPDYAKLDFGTIINGFLIESKIGQGGMGVVYKAKQLNLERYVALKVLAEHLASGQEFVERFFKEARAAANLNHPNIVQVYDAGSTIDGIYYFAMELIEGETLEARLLRDGFLPAKEGLDIAVKIARALEYAWERQKLTHGDIKPDNIIINSSGGVKLADLGLAKNIHDEKSTRDGGIMATPLYAPPEVIAGEFHKINFKSDMYSYGATLYHMFAGVPPFYADNPELVLRMHVTDKHIPLKLKNKEINPIISDIIDKLLLKNPEERPSSWTEVASSLEKIKDVERKVFHIPTHIPEKDFIEIAEGSSDEGFKLYHLISALIVVLLILSALTTIIYLKASKPERKETEKIPSTNNSEEMKKEWELIKTRVNAMPSQDAIGLVERFMEKYQGMLPGDTAAFYENLKKKALKEISEEERRTKMQKVFSTQIEEIIKELSAANLSNMNFLDLNFHSKRIETLLSVISSKNINLQIEQEKREKLNSIYLKLTQQIMALRKIEEDSFRKKLEEERLKQLEQQRIQKEKAEKARAQKLASNIAIDSYYIAISDSLDPVKMNTSLSELIKNNKDILPQQIQRNIEFIRSNYIFAPDAIIAQLQKVENSLKNKYLPISGIGQEYKLEEISDKGIKFQRYIDKVKMGKLIQWQQLSQEDIKTIIENAILSNESYSLELSDLSKFASYLVLNCQFDSLRKLLNKILPEKNPQKTGWLNFLSDIEYARTEKDAILKMVLVRENIASKNMLIAAENLSEMLYLYSNTDTYKRYDSEIQLLVPDLLIYTQMIHCAIFLNLAKKFLNENRIDAAIQCIYTAKARTLKATDKELFNNLIAKEENKIISSIPKSIEVPKVFAPFYYWEREKFFDTITFFNTLNDRPEFKRTINQIPEIQPLIEASVNLSTGNWGGVKLENNSPNILSEIQGPASYIIPSLLFSSYLYFERMSSNLPRPEYHQLFQQTLARFTKSKIGFPLTTHLFSEYLIFSGRFQRVVENLSSYDLKNIENDFDAILPFLNIYCKINLAQIPADLEKDIILLLSILENSKPTKGDAIWLKYSMKILAGNNLSKEEVDELSNTTPHNFDLSFRIMISSLAIRIANSGTPEFFKQICNIMTAKMSGMTAHFITFRNLAYLRLATNSNTFEGFREELERLLFTPQVASIPIYPELTIFELITATATGKIREKELKELLARRLSETSMTSPAEIKYSSIISDSEKYSTFISDCIAKEQVNTAFSASIAFMMSSAGKKEIVRNIYKEMQNHIAFLSVEQKLLLNAVAKLAEK